MNGTGPAMVPIFVTCATGHTLSRWAGHHYPFNPRECRGVAFDPQAWRGGDGLLYIAVATGGCNSTTHAAPCTGGVSMYLWRAPALLAPPSEWGALGPMITTKDDAMTKGAGRGEMVTPSFTGHLAGDPLGGRARLLTNNICAGTSYHLGASGMVPSSWAGWGAGSLPASSSKA